MKLSWGFCLISNCTHTPNNSRLHKREWQQYQCHTIKLTLKPQHTTNLSEWHRHVKAFLDFVSDQAQNHKHQQFITNKQTKKKLPPTLVQHSFQAVSLYSAAAILDPGQILTIVHFSTELWLSCFFVWTLGRSCWTTLATGCDRHKRTRPGFSKLRQLTPALYTGRPTAKILSQIQNRVHPDPTNIKFVKFLFHSKQFLT